MAHKPKRVGFVLDMTPLVDIAFLLLTFFMFTAKFKSEAENEQSFEIKRPSASADTTKLPEIGTGMIQISIEEDTRDTAIWYAISNEKDREPIHRMIPGMSPENIGKALVPVKDTVALGHLILASRKQDRKMKFVVDADRRVEFAKIEQIMNTLRSQGATLFNFVTVPSDQGGGNQTGAAG